MNKNPCKMEVGFVDLHSGRLVNLNIRGFYSERWHMNLSLYKYNINTN